MVCIEIVVQTVCFAHLVQFVLDCILSFLKQVVTWALKKMALTAYADRPVRTYSGGNKRKLSTAIALLGNPDIIFMVRP